MIQLDVLKFSFCRQYLFIVRSDSLASGATHLLRLRLASDKRHGVLFVTFFLGLTARAGVEMMLIPRVILVTFVISERCGVVMIWSREAVFTLGCLQRGAVFVRVTPSSGMFSVRAYKNKMICFELFLDILFLASTGSILGWRHFLSVLMRFSSRTCRDKASFTVYYNNTRSNSTFRPAFYWLLFRKCSK